MDRDDAEDGVDDLDTPWLRDTVEDDLLGLFSSEREEVQRTARLLLARAGDDPGVTERLIDALRTSIEEHNDDTEASLWIALLLGEIGELSALPVLFLGLGSDDEPLQEAAGDAILRMGPPALVPLMEELDEEPGPEFVDAAYRLLASAGSFRDPQLRERVIDFLADRVEREAAKPPLERRIESLFQSSALLGDRRMIPAMDRVLRERFGGRNTAIRDAREMLAENQDGTPIVHDPLPWVEAHRWLFEEDLEASRVPRGEGGRPLAEPDPGSPEEGGEASDGDGEGPAGPATGYYRGLSVVPRPPDEEADEEEVDPPPRPSEGISERRGRRPGRKQGGPPPRGEDPG